MSIFIILVLCFVYGYCSALERGMRSYSSFSDRDYYDRNTRIFEKFRVSGYSKAWDKSKFIR